MVQINPTSGRVWVRSHPCLFGTSIVDSIVNDPGEVVIDSRNNLAQVFQQQQQHQCFTKDFQHYDRTLVQLQPLLMEQYQSNAAEKESTKTGVKLWRYNNPEESTIDGEFNQNVGLVRIQPIQSLSNSSWLLPMGRARECPNMGSTSCPTTVPSTQIATERQRKQNTTSRAHPGLAVVGIVTDNSQGNDGRILITRRPTYMRSFPGAWVLPGGGVDPYERLEEAVAREVLEETGLSLNSMAIHPLCLWESVYPTIPCPDVPIRAHHLVAYFLCGAVGGNRKGQHEELDLNLQDEEVDCAVWLTPEEVEYVIEKSRQQGRSGKYGAGGQHLDRQERSVTAYMANGTEVDIPLDRLVGIYPQKQNHTTDSFICDDGNSEICGLAQGSLFALEELILSSIWWGRGSTSEIIPSKL